ncbi:O-antigen biosynthesis protein WbqP [Cytobacillus oceanisediminis]|uniref:O-antigen biosynthesis protein WbqP n=2 Tax=Cytobacillus oceanisediminis TaxID=665099 RepID=A0A2V3A3J5_9BACI|nr:O-antigen biosynthesis protein WbqP [Cytobacillus oceanisediminis]
MKNKLIKLGCKLMYLKVKRLIDIFLSLIGLIVLSPIFLFLIIAIKLDSKGPVLFKQKRVGINKTHFNILKFRTMRIDTPKDTPTHLLENPEQYITKMGNFLRKTSLDELPQIINIFKGEMSIIGPRPALWNQYNLIEERDKYGANDVPVGLTGWAQINGRDELEIDVKAKLDGEYAENIGLLMDIRCFFGTIFSVLRSDGVVEGGTGVKTKTTSATSNSTLTSNGVKSTSKAEETVAK